MPALPATIPIEPQPLQLLALHDRLNPLIHQASSEWLNNRFRNPSHVSRTLHSTAREEKQEEQKAPDPIGP
jgi:hypothetical protein